MSWAFPFRSCSSDHHDGVRRDRLRNQRSSVDTENCRCKVYVAKPCRYDTMNIAELSISYRKCATSLAVVFKSRLGVHIFMQLLELPVQ